MGRGDKKTTKGKRSKGSFGVSRNKQDIKTRLKNAASRKPEAVATTEADAEAKPKRTAAKKKAE